MDWFNLTGLIFVVVLLIPNIIYAVTNKDGFADNYHNKFIEAGEQIGRLGCFILMFIQLPFVTLGYIYDGAQTLRNLKRIFDEKKINAWCDFWGSDVSHDWYWWFIQLRYFIPILLEDQG